MGGRERVIGRGGDIWRQRGGVEREIWEERESGTKTNNEEKEKGWHRGGVIEKGGKRGKMEEGERERGGG
jgi:hypothetical protein